MASTEWWQRGPIEGVPCGPSTGRPHPSSGARECRRDRGRLDRREMELLAQAAWHRRPSHVCHMAGVIDRLFTYARGHSLSEEQFAALRSEGDELPVRGTSREGFRDSVDPGGCRRSRTRSSARSTSERRGLSCSRPRAAAVDRDRVPRPRRRTRDASCRPIVGDDPRCSPVLIGGYCAIAVSAVLGQFDLHTRHHRVK